MDDSNNNGYYHGRKTLAKETDRTTLMPSLSHFEKIRLNTLIEELSPLVAGKGVYPVENHSCSLSDYLWQAGLLFENELVNLTAMSRNTLLKSRYENGAIHYGEASRKISCLIEV